MAPRLWDPSIAIAPDGSFAAFAAIPMQARMPEPDERPDVWIADRTGRTLARRSIDGIVQGISTGGCVLTQERDRPSARDDLVGRDRRLNEVWRIPDAYSIWSISPQHASDLLIQHHRSTLAAYRLPRCSPALDKPARDVARSSAPQTPATDQP